jgi:hypothetical protein
MLGRISRFVLRDLPFLVSKRHSMSGTKTGMKSERYRSLQEISCSRFACRTKKAHLARIRDASRLTAAGGASAVPAGGGSSLSHSGGFGISLPVLRPVREVLTGLGQARRG